ncbi:MAG: asparagine synthase B [Bdellovibrionales bacterium]|nr:asparagine synthase B [Bdellovibrionales bacterium]
MCGFLVSTKSVSEKSFKSALKTIEHRGPDHSQVLKVNGDGLFGFQRLSIMDLSAQGHQPFTSPQGSYLVCNGEIYNHLEIRTDFVAHYDFQSHSDCEVLLPLYEEYGLEFLCRNVEAEFALVIYDSTKQQWLAARDPIGIRPLFYGKDRVTGHLFFASEVKALLSFCDQIEVFPPGHYYQEGQFHCYVDYKKRGEWITDESIALKGIAERLERSVRQRLCADAPVGFLLSGGLDSSLVCALAARMQDQPIQTFAIGFEREPIDLKYAREVADFIGSEHHEVIFSESDIERILEPLVYQLETYDITTIRASVGMYLVCEYIKKNTDVKVLLTGEVSDEIFGYKYTDFAPSAEEFQKEAEKRVTELYMYDVLRADRCISSHSLEARVPFADHDFVEHVMRIDPSLKMNTTGVGKALLRKAFAGQGLLPDSILFREKAAFSDAVGHGMVDYLKARAEKLYSDSEFKSRSFAYKGIRPISKESLMYRELFDRWFAQQVHLIKDYWMPNSEWAHCQVDDPSARVLPNYGQSGS